jgi:tRNA-uridine 2-sulfurtransferase
VSQTEPVGAVALVSGGLDSLLAAKIVSDLGVTVTALHCVFRFDPTASERKQQSLAAVSDQIGLPIRHLDISEDMIAVMRDPDHGFGKGVNPCIDCHLLMIRKAWELAGETGGRFIITGEVAGQRPMSQGKTMLRHIEKLSGLDGLILRPLSALALPVTIPEERKWVPRDRLHGIVGRSRREQMRLAESYGILDYEQPAGGCILTMPQYADRAKRLWRQKPRSTVGLQDMQLLRFGRHLWPNEHLHLIVGRDEDENRRLEAYREGLWSFTAENVQGPLVLAEGIENDHDIQTAAAVTARYSDGKSFPLVTVKYDGPSAGQIETTPAKPEETEAWILQDEA